jgi:hypothetical protein
MGSPEKEGSSRYWWQWSCPYNSLLGLNKVKAFKVRVYILNPIDSVSSR